MKFNNRENERVELKDGRVVWLSRSVAVVGTVCLNVDNVTYFLISQRGPGSADNQGLWCLPCGYLDWDETTEEAYIREVWEECGVNVKDEKFFHFYSYGSDPWDFSSVPIENRQNVTVHHFLYASASKLPETKVDKSEVSEARWITIDQIDDFDYAFNHKERLKKFIEKFITRKRI